VVVLCVAGVVTLVVVGLNKANELAGPAHVVAEVTGSAPAQVTFSINGSVAETGTRGVPYSITRDVTRGGKVVSVTAQTTTPGGTASCRILVNGTVMMSRTATGFNTQAVCETYV
jgi:hypothetical protein